MRSSIHLLFLAANLLWLPNLHAQQKPRISFDELFNFVEYREVKISPDGSAVIIATRRADWQQERFRDDIWLWREGSPQVTLLTSSGHDTDPEWSPDGRWIAFLSERPLPAEKEPEERTQPQPQKPENPAVVPPKPRGADADDEKKSPVSHVYLLSMTGGEAFPVTRGEEEVHSFAWSPDSQSIYFATRAPWSKARRDAYKRDWKDVIRYRESERGDVIARISLAESMARRAAMGGDEMHSSNPSEKKSKEEETAETPGAVTVAITPDLVKQLVISPDGGNLAFVTDSPSKRVEDVQAYEIYLANTSGGAPRRITNNQAIEEDLHWAPDSKNLFFVVSEGAVEGPYRDLQRRVYSVNVGDGRVQRWAQNFSGAIDNYSVSGDGALAFNGRMGTEVQNYSQSQAAANFTQDAGWPGTYAHISLASHSPRLAFLYSALDKPTEVYVANSLADLKSARAITSLNQIFTQRDLPQGKPYRWKADDGSTVEGMLIYPPGKFGARHLRMLTLIHGGPEDADGNVFFADWYYWAILAAGNNWLVFQPNYRGSIGYGDRFMTEIVPQIVSRPGKDIMEGVDALIADGIADPDQLAIGGYSYGGYMTNWLITQTTRFKAAVTGAGAVEHAANWGNDDLTFDDAYYLGGLPWDAKQRYNDEAALWQLNKIKTPTHLVAGENDIRVSVAEDYLLERALHALNVPSTLLVFPGEGHSLGKNPWHGRIKVREELKWLEKYLPEKK